MDDQELRQYRRSRETVLTLVLSLFAGVCLLFCLVLVTGGFFLYVALGVAALAAVGSLHYALWGRLFSQQVAGEREELELRERAEADGEGWQITDEPHRFRRF